jgi:tetratricopeptide (TPR) repeat protein
MSAGTIIRRTGLAACVVLILAVALPSVRQVRAEEAPDATKVKQMLDLALHDMMKGRFEIALKRTEDALDLDPKNVAANQYRADICSVWSYEYNKAKLEESKKTLADLRAELLPITVIMDNVRGNKADAAIKQIKETIRQAPETDSRSLNQYVLALAYLRAGKGLEAANALSDAIGWDGEFEQAYADLANIYMQLGRVNDALTMTDALLRVNKDNDDWLLLRAFISASANRGGEALYLATTLLKKYENAPESAILNKTRKVSLAHEVLAVVNYRNYALMPVKEKMEELLKPAQAQFDAADKEKNIDTKLDLLSQAVSSTAIVIGQINVQDLADLVDKAKGEKDANKKATLAQDAADKIKAFIPELAARKEKFLQDMKTHAQGAIDADPLLGEPYALRATYYARTGEDADLENAAKEYLEYIRLRPDSSQSQRYSLGIIRLIQKKNDDAVKVFAEIKDANSEQNELSFMGAGLIASLAGKADDARNAFEALRKVRDKKQLPQNAFFELMLGHACLAQNKPQDAVDHLKVGAAALGGLAISDKTNYSELLGPADAQAIGKLNFALALSDAGFSNQAIAQCEEFLKAVPGSIAGRFFHFMLLRNKPERSKEAEQDIAILKADFPKKDPTNVTPFLAEAILLGDTGRKETDQIKRLETEEKMVSAYKAAIDANPTFGNTYAVLGEFRINRGEIFTAIKEAKYGLEEGLKQDPTNTTVLQTLVRAMQAGGEAKPDDFTKLYNQYLENVRNSSKPGLDPVDGMFSLAMYYRQLGRNAEARKEFTDAHEMIEGTKDDQEKTNKRKKYILVYMNLRELSLSDTNLADARKYNKEIKDIDPESPGANHFDGLCYLLEGKYDEAQKAFETEISLGNLSMPGAMAKGGLAVIALKKAAKVEDVSAVHAYIDSGQKMMKLLLDRENLVFRRDAGNIRLMGGYLAFMRVCAYLAQAKFLQPTDPKEASNKMTYAGRWLNMAAVLFPGAEGWQATQTSAFKNINLAADVLPKWTTDANFTEMAEGSFFLGQGVFTKARERLEAAAQRDPSNFIALLFEARAQQALGNEPRTIELLKKSQEDTEGKKCISTFTELYTIYLKGDMKNQDEICKVLDAMCALDPQFRYEYAHFLSLNYRSAKPGENIDLALAQYELLIKEINLPNRWAALNGAAWLRAENRADKRAELTTAETQVKEAVSLITDDPKIPPPDKVGILATVNDTYGWVLYKAGKLSEVEKKNDEADAKYQQAADIFNKCVEGLAQVPQGQASMPTVLYHLGLAYDAMRLRAEAAGNKDKAAENLKKAIDALRDSVRYGKFDDKKKAEDLLNNTLLPIAKKTKGAPEGGVPAPKTGDTPASPAGPGTPPSTPKPAEPPANP